MLQLLFLVTAMIDPRNMPRVRVCIARMPPHELPHNALKQYHNYAAKRKAGDSTPNEIGETQLNGIAVHLPVDFSFVSAKNGHEHKCHRSRCTSCTRTTSNTFSVSDFYVPLQDKCQAIFNFLNASNGNVHTTPNVSHLSGNTSIVTQENDKSDVINGFCHHDDTSLDSNDSPEASNSRSAIGVFNTQPNKVESGRHSALSIISSHHSVVSNGKEQTASVPHSPAMSDPVECILKPVLNFGPKNDGEVNHASATDYLEKRTRNHSYGLRNIVKPRDFSYEVASISSSSSAGDLLEPSTLSDESSSIGFSSCKDLDVCDYETWPDLGSYSPPESPVQETESVGHYFSLDAETFSTVSKRVPSGSPFKSEISDTFCNSMKSRVRRSTLNHVELLSPEIKLVPLSVSSGRQLEGESSSLKKELVVKLYDVGKSLKKRRNGGFTLVPGRCTASGRKALSNYSENVLPKSSSKHIISATEKQSHRKKLAKNARSVCDAEYKRDRKKKIKVRKNLSDRREKYFMARYGNLQFKELNTISRMSSRYKVAFTKWPRVFSGALDLINQRLANQNAFWNTIRS